jgi:hypothetical protein
MEIPDTWASLLVSAVRDAVLFHENLLQSETLQQRHEYEEHHTHLTQLLEFVKDEYRMTVEAKGGTPLAKFLPDAPPESNVLPFKPLADVVSSS